MSKYRGIYRGPGYRVSSVKKESLARQDEIARRQSTINQLQAELTHYRHACQSIGETDGHGWAETTKELRNTVEAQREEIGRLQKLLSQWIVMSDTGMALEDVIVLGERTLLESKKALAGGKED